MGNNRRTFLKVAGVSALCIGAKPVVDAFASTHKAPESKTPDKAHEVSHEGSHGGPKAEYLTGENALKAKKWGLVIDTRKFKSAEDLQPMIDACNGIHNIPKFDTLPEAVRKRHEIKWIWEDEYEHVFPDSENTYLNERLEHLPFLVLCNHCENPPCVRACPTKATFKRADGIVMMDYHRCIGCRFCMAACPYGSRSFNFRDPRPFIKAEDRNLQFPTRTKGVVEKCNFCAERLAVGKMPACVEASSGALIFGDLGDPQSAVREALKSNYTIRRKPGLGTGPQVYYIV